MKLALLIACTLVVGCGSKSAAPEMGSSATPGSATLGSATPGSATVITGRDATATAGSGPETTGGTTHSSAATLDPRFAKLSPEEQHTCKAYALCKVELLKDDDPNATARQPEFLNSCFEVWIGLAAGDRAKIAGCADRGGDCGAVLPCFDSLKLKP